MHPPLPVELLVEEEEEEEKKKKKKKEPRRSPVSFLPLGNSYLFGISPAFGHVHQRKKKPVKYVPYKSPKKKTRDETKGR